MNDATAMLNRPTIILSSTELFSLCAMQLMRSCRKQLSAPVFIQMLPSYLHFAIQNGNNICCYVLSFKKANVCC